VDKFSQQKQGMAMGNSLSPVVIDIFMEHNWGSSIEYTRPQIY
jgi:hypothetical protein